MKTYRSHLTARQKLFCEHYVGAGKHCAALAARLAGYAPGCSHVTGCQLLKKPKIAARVSELESEASRGLRLGRADVMAQLVKAAEMARELQEPGPLINAWKQLALMCGFYKSGAMPVGVLTPAQAAQKAKFEAMTDAELMAIMAGGVANDDVGL